jgi:phage gpG-like protein
VSGTLDVKLVGVGKALERITSKTLRLPVETHLACLRGAHVLEGAIKLHIRQNPHDLKWPDRRGQMFHEGLIDTGAMMNSVQVTPIPQGAEVGPRVEYAAYQEYGYVNHIHGNPVPPRPFMRPAIDEKRHEVEQIVKRAVEKELRR